VAGQPSKTSANWREELLALIQRAIAEGRHSDGPSLVVCQGCGKWCPGYFHKTMDGKLFGVCCTPQGEIDRVKKLAEAQSHRRH
jgi:hypothetical protein